jgi:hypothetical protein
MKAATPHDRVGENREMNMFSFVLSSTYMRFPTSLESSQFESTDYGTNGMGMVGQSCPAPPPSALHHHKTCPIRDRP